MRRIAPLLVLLTFTPLLALAASNSDVEFRNCMRLATIDRENRLVEVLMFRTDRLKDAAFGHRDGYVEIWNIEDDRARRDAQRIIDTDTRNREREAEKLYRDDARAANETFRFAERGCRDAMRQRDKDRRSVPVGRRCFSTNECSPPLGACTVDFGVCNSTCTSGTSGNSCVQVCAGTCVMR